MTTARAYFDYNATAPLRPQARAAMQAALEHVGNPSSVHAEGRAAREIVEAAREQVAALAGARPADVTFTSGATEACNLALRAPWRTIARARIEHVAVLAPSEASGARILDLPVDGNGRVDPGAVADALASAGAPEAALDGARGPASDILVAIQAANNETGVVQPVAEIVAHVRRYGAVTFCDAVQAAGRLDPFAYPADMVALSAHKIGGPMGVGALVVRAGALPPAMLVGGGQERGRRAGTENVAAIAGFGAAAQAALAETQRWSFVNALREQVEQILVDSLPGAVVIAAGAPRLPNTICLGWPGRTAELLVARLDLGGVAVSAGSACASGKVGASHVLAAMGVPAAIARSAIRISLGPQPDVNDLEMLLSALLAIRGPEHGLPIAAREIQGDVRRRIETIVGAS